MPLLRMAQHWSTWLMSGYDNFEDVDERYDSGEIRGMMALYD